MNKKGATKHRMPLRVAVKAGHMGVTAGPAVSEASIGSRGVSVVAIESISVSLGISCSLGSGLRLGLGVPLAVVGEAMDGAAHVAGGDSGVNSEARSVISNMGLGLSRPLAVVEGSGVAEGGGADMAHPGGVE